MKMSSKKLEKGSSPMDASSEDEASYASIEPEQDPASDARGHQMLRHSHSKAFFSHYFSLCGGLGTNEKINVVDILALQKSHPILLHVQFLPYVLIKEKCMITFLECQ